MRPADTENFGPVGTNSSQGKPSTPQDEIRRLRDELQEYITAEKVMIAAGKVSQATVEQAHELVRNLK